MKKYIGIVIMLVLFSCKKEEVTNGDGKVSFDHLEERVTGRWNIERVTYSGVAPIPNNETVIVPFSGVGKAVAGYYDFDTVSNPTEFDFEANFEAPLEFSGATFMAAVNERGYGFCSVDTLLGQIHGTSYVVQTSGHIDTVETVWQVTVNEEDRQVWTSVRSFYFDYNPDLPVLVDMETTLTR